MYSDWQAEARRRVAALHAIMAKDTPLAERRKVLRAEAMSFHGGTSWGRKVWAKHCRNYLEMHGQPPRARKAPEQTGTLL